MTAVPAPAGPGAFIHPALFYRDLTEYLSGVGDFVRAALAADEPVLVAVPGPRLDALRESLGTGGEAGITWTDMTELGRNPGRVLAALQEFADRHAGRAARIVGEPIWPGRSPAEVLEATRHEALVNTAFAGRPATVLCPYDVVGLAPGVVSDARRTHPTSIERGRDLPSPAYADASALSADLDRPLPEPAGPVGRLAYSHGGLAEVREYAEEWARGTALSPARRGDLIMAISEAAANSLAHGGGKGTLRLWTVGGPAAQEPGPVTGGPAGPVAGVIAEIHDGGLLADPLAGRRRPSLASSDGGRGLWMIHQLCDLVEVRATEGGFTLRLHLATR
ncbi:sensor histidine kinase [Streptomyces yangpuensis]|uniref:Sensor histidine kinase n=1 Tax=Streptomyces yangpuensis TaxID=1648182 RepID=A0ABY5PPU5_9ACTN|nr:sensor histidine kinase [Streptomyces yangpuensis]UUY46009.1 sensor histidine kinase [Streptomyces yangpuensis]